MRATDGEIAPDGERAPGLLARLAFRLRRFYGWVLREAETPSGAAGLVVLAFSGSALVPLFLEPPLMVLTTGLPRLWRRFALLFALGSILGGVAAYVIGYAFIETIGRTVIQFWGAEASWQSLMSVAQGRWGFALVAAISVGPGPYKLVTMAAGATEMSFPVFLGILVLGRSARFLAVAWLTRVFGPRFTEWLRKRRASAVYGVVLLLLLIGTAVYFAIIQLTR